MGMGFYCCEQKIYRNSLSLSLSLSLVTTLVYIKHILYNMTMPQGDQGAWAIIKVMGHQHWWLAGGYELEIEHF